RDPGRTQGPKGNGLTGPSIPTPTPRVASRRAEPRGAWARLRGPGAVGAAAGEHGAHGAPQDDEIAGARPVLDVVEVAAHAVRPRQVRSAADPPHPGEPRLDAQAALRPLLIAVDLAQQRGPRADQRHIAPQHIPQLRQLIQAETAQERAERRHPWV